MKSDLCLLKDEPLAVSIPETKDELKTGWTLRPLECDGLLFELKRFTNTVPLWCPVVIGKNADHLDVLWIDQGRVSALATMRGGLLQGFADYVLELPAGYCAAHGVKLGDAFVIGGTQADA